MTAEERGALVAQHHAQHLLQGLTGLTISGVDVLLDWAAPLLEHHKGLLKMVLFDRVY